MCADVIWTAESYFLSFSLYIFKMFIIWMPCFLSAIVNCQAVNSFINGLFSSDLFSLLEWDPFPLSRRLVKASEVALDVNALP